jgi:HAD superfamily hydrolase (TIGR01509 family)
VTTAEGWLPYLDAASTLHALHQAGVRTAVVSNIGFDLRPLLSAWGLLPLFDAVLLSYEANCIKPDPKIFWRACAQLGVEPERTLMIGDTAADAGAVTAGCSALILPSASAGRANGLHQAVRLALNPPL